LAAEHDDGAVVLVVILVAAEAREAPALPPHDDNAATLALVIKGDAALFFAFVVSAHYLFPRRTVWSSDAIYPEHENENDPLRKCRRSRSNSKIWFYQSLLLAREDTNHPLEKAKNTVYSRPSLKCDGGGRLLKY
jgi:hypothetical protein